MILGSQKPDKDRLKDLPTEAAPHPIPEITSLTPETMVAGQPPVDIRVKGRNFVRGCMVKLANAGVATQFVSGTELKATPRKDDVANPGAVDVTVFNPRPGGGLSNVKALTVEAPKPPTS